MSKLSDIREFSKKLSKSARWHSTNKAIMHISGSTNSRKRSEYIYEFYCVLRVLSEMNLHYDDIGIVNTKFKKVFPKAPGSKEKFPYFSIKSKGRTDEEFQLCYGTEIYDDEGISFAPDISFQRANSSLIPNCSDVLMIWDAKYKHDQSDSVHRSEFLYVAGLIRSLDLESIKAKDLAHIKLGTLSLLLSNCILTNGKAYVTGSKFHKKHLLKEVERFTSGKAFKVID